MSWWLLLIPGTILHAVGAGASYRYFTQELDPARGIDDASMAAAIFWPVFWAFTLPFLAGDKLARKLLRPRKAQGKLPKATVVER